jgi:hypothetical protein
LGYTYGVAVSISLCEIRAVGQEKPGKDRGKHRKKNFHVS